MADQISWAEFVRLYGPAIRNWLIQWGLQEADAQLARRNPAVAALTAALSTVLVVAFVLITWFWLKAKETAANEREAKEDAKRSALIAIRNEAEATRQRLLREGRQEELEFGRALSTCEEGRIAEGLQQFLRALALAEEVKAVDLAHAIRINLAAWPAELPPPRRGFVHVNQPCQAAFFPDGEHIVTAGRGGEVYLWNLNTGKKERTYECPKLFGNPFVDVGYRLTYWCVAVSPDGKLIAGGGSDRAGAVREWDPRSGRQLRTWQINGWVADIAVSPDGSRLAATGPEGVARVFNLRGRRPTTEISLGGAYGNGIAFAGRRPFVLTADGDGSVRIWHQDTGQQIGSPYRFSGEVTKIRSRNGSDRFSVPAGDSVHVTRVPNPPVEVLSAGFGQRMRGLDFSANGDRLAATDDNYLQIFDPANGKLIRLVEYWVQGVNSRRSIAVPLTMRYDPDPIRSQVFRGVRNGLDRLAVPDGKLAVKGPTPFLGRVKQIDFLNGGREVLALDDNRVARLDGTTLKQLWIGRPVANVPCRRAAEGDADYG